MAGLRLLCVTLILSTLVAVRSQTCATDGSDYSYTETVSGDTRTLVTTFCPNHPYKNINPNYPIKTSTTYTVPAYPKYDTSNTADLTSQGGIVGVLFNGAMLFSPYGGPNYGSVTGYSNSATAAEGDTFDLCGCHASSTTSSSYHCHVPPDCLLQQLNNTAGSHSPQVGWAADGFPVYGPLGPNGIQMFTCTTLGQTYGTDVCTNDEGGYLAELSSVDNFKFRYYTLGTENGGLSCSNPRGSLPNSSFYPNTPTMYYGCCPSGVSCSGSFLSTCGSSAVDGYTASYTPSSSIKYASGLPLNCDACWASGESGTTPSSCSTSSSSPSPSSSPGSRSPSPSSSPTSSQSPGLSDTELEAYQTSKYGMTSFGLDSVPNMGSTERQTLVNAITATETISQSNTTRVYVDIASSSSLSVAAASSGTAVTITDFGTGATKAVVENRAASNAMLSSLGLSNADSLAPSTIIQVMRLDSSGNSISSSQVTLTIPSDGATTMTVYTYNSSSTTGTDITTEGGSVTLSGSDFVVVLPHTSVASAHRVGASPSPSTAPSDDDSNEALWGLMALLVLPLCICPLLLWYCAKKRKGEKLQKKDSDVEMDSPSSSPTSHTAGKNVEMERAHDVAPANTPANTPSTNSNYPAARGSYQPVPTYDPESRD